MLKLLVLAAAACAALAAPRGAFACDCGTLSGMLSGLGDKIVSGVTPPVENTIREAAAYSSANFREDMTALRETVMLMKDSVVGAIEAADKSGADRVTERTYEPGSQPETICGNDVLGASRQLGAENTERAGRDILERVLERPRRHQRPLDYALEAASAEWPGAEAVLSLGIGRGARTYTLEETAQAEKVVESLSNPSPPPQLSDGLKNTPAGRSYEAMRKDYELRLSVYQSVLASSAAARAPAIDGLGAWVRSRWALMGGSGDPPGLIDGKLSEETLFWYLANVRLSSANWHEEALAALPEAGLLREIAAMEAVSLELVRRQNELLRDMLTVMTVGGLEGLSGERRKGLLAQYSLAAGGPAE
jgi:hypothetical protein